MTPAELRKEIANTHPGWWLRPILEELLRLWEAAEAVLDETECTTMGGIIEPGKTRRDTVNYCKQKAWLIDDLKAALDELEKIKS